MLDSHESGVARVSAVSCLLIIPLLLAACGLPKKVLIGSGGDTQWVDRAEPLRYSTKAEPTFCTVNHPPWPAPSAHYSLVRGAPFRDIRLLTREHPGPQGCDVLLKLEYARGDIFVAGTGTITAYSAYTREHLWAGQARDGSNFDGAVDGLEILAPHLHRAFQPGQPAFERLAYDKARGRPATVEDIEEFAGMGLFSESGIADWRQYIRDVSAIKLGKARPAEGGPRPAAPPAAQPALRPAVASAPVSSDVDEAPARQAAVKGHAVIIGIERYRERLPRADFAAADARTMARYASRVLGYAEQNVALLTDEAATRGDFEKYLERWLLNRVGKDDEVFVYFSGHGAPNPSTGDAYLVPYDGDPTYLNETGYPLRRLYASLGKLPTRRITVALDSCFSGGGGRSVLARGARPLVLVKTGEPPAGITVISAASGSQISNTYPSQGHGLFTYFLLKGLQEHGRDLRQAFASLKPEVERVARQENNSDQVPQWRESR